MYKKGINSDSDIFLVKIKDKEEGIKIIKKAYKYANKDMLDNNIKRILNLKDKYKINDDINYNGIDIDKINKEIEEVNSKI